MNKVKDEIEKANRSFEEQKSYLATELEITKRALEEEIAALLIKKKDLQASSDYKLLSEKILKVSEREVVLSHKETDLNNWEQSLLLQEERLSHEKSAGESKEFALKQAEELVKAAQVRFDIDQKNLLKQQMDLQEASDRWQKRVEASDRSLAERERVVAEQSHANRILFEEIENERKKLLDERKLIESKRAALRNAKQLYAKS